MKKIYPGLFTLFFSLIFSPAGHAIEEKIYQLQGLDSIETVLEKLGASKNASLPATFKNNEQEITVEIQNAPERIVSIAFQPAHTFTVTDSDLFEKIELGTSSDRVDYKILVSDPKSGRIFHLNQELKVVKLELVSPWKNKAKLRSLKEILTEMKQKKNQLVPMKKAVK